MNINNPLEKEPARCSTTRKRTSLSFVSKQLNKSPRSWRRTVEETRDLFQVTLRLLSEAAQQKPTAHCNSGEKLADNFQMFLGLIQ